MARSATSGDFLGRGWSFPPSFDRASGCVRMVSDDTDIQQSLQILFTTMLQERVMLPEYGADLGQFVFDAASSTLFAQIRTRLNQAILNWEPRIAVDDIVIVASALIDGLLEIGLTYTILQTNTRSNMVYPFYLQGEGTNVRPIG
ncbi:GPW/gp25 family protein [Massilia sp. TS11]|uniref:GPW/gp25 family protein n=1 Tax=Massilia sp. TS11 TaxID=2908003 RepID=UPI001EDC8100|nr:GPW/gp25 family protein [Massilia sp. TS11]MCG2584157.1 GPW/gp25 family protein [Massilia sp. TS11]